MRKVSGSPSKLRCCWVTRSMTEGAWRGLYGELLKTRTDWRWLFGQNRTSRSTN